MSVWYNISPWVHRYKAVQSSDEENNRPEASGHPGLLKTFPRAFLRIPRLVLVLLVLGVFAYLFSILSVDGRFSDLRVYNNSSNSPASEIGLEISQDTYINADWSKFAYTQYVTGKDYLCNSLMIFETLHRLGSKAERLMMYPEQWSLESNSSEADLLRRAREDYNVKMVPIHVQHFAGEATWGDSFTKLLAFNQTQYERVISLDSDANVLQPMDELFFLPRVPVAMPRAYWLNNTLSSQLVVIQPSKQEFERILYAFEHRQNTDFDMEIVNNLYGRDCLILPHRRYDLLSGEFRGTKHQNYLGSTTEVWNPRQVLQEAKFLHFSDWPYPKPWIAGDESIRIDIQPACHVTASGEDDCSDRDVWNEIYREFKDRRQKVCGLDFVHRFKRLESRYTRGLPSPLEPIF
ncbi:nucleotide-diphospho-sugar transferase [Aureobasidium pullulans]|nr:nucleotide-diphospho-sugar transferase [Aureobasidium pullulans]